MTFPTDGLSTVRPVDVGMMEVQTPTLASPATDEHPHNHYKPLGPCCEWPRWKGGDPGDRWPTDTLN